jgi:hypothetical protein
MPDFNIVTRLLETPGFGWQCGEPLRDKGSYFRCSCGCSQPDADSDGYLTILQPKILREAAQEIERLRVERDEARREICENVAAISASVNAKQWAQERGWDCYKQEDGK